MALTRFDALSAIAAEYPTEPIVVALGTMVREMLLVGRQDVAGPPHALH